MAHVDFRYGSTTGHVRFRKLEGAQAAFAALSGGAVSIGSAAPAWSTLTAEQAEEYWKQAEASRAAFAAGQAPSGYGGVARPAPRDASEKGVVLRFDGAASNTERNDLTALCAHYGDVAYVDFKFGATSGHVRFRSTLGARTALGQLSSGTVMVGGAFPTWRMLSEEEEAAYREAVQAKKQESRKRPRDDGPPQQFGPPPMASGRGSPSLSLSLAVLTPAAAAPVERRAPAAAAARPTERGSASRRGRRRRGGRPICPLRRAPLRGCWT